MAPERLRGWDGRMDANAVEPLIFTAWLRELNRGLFEERLGSGFADYWGLRPLVVRDILTSHPEWCSDASPPITDNCDTGGILPVLDTGADVNHQASLGRIAAQLFQRNLPLLEDSFLQQPERDRLPRHRL